jgi:hypothetical protein
MRNRFRLFWPGSREKVHMRRDPYFQTENLVELVRDGNAAEFNREGRKNR